MEREVVELAQLRVSQFRLDIRDLLDTTGALDPAVLEQRFNEFVEESDRVVVRDGRFVLVRIYDPAGQLLLDVDLQLPFRRPSRWTQARSRASSALPPRTATFACGLSGADLDARQGAGHSIQR